MTTCSQRVVVRSEGTPPGAACATRVGNSETDPARLRVVSVMMTGEHDGGAPNPLRIARLSSPKRRVCASERALWAELLVALLLTLAVRTVLGGELGALMMPVDVVHLTE